MKPHSNSRTTIVRWSTLSVFLILGVVGYLFVRIVSDRNEEAVLRDYFQRMYQLDIRREANKSFREHLHKENLDLPLSNHRVTLVRYWDIYHEDFDRVHVTLFRKVWVVEDIRTNRFGATADFADILSLVISESPAIQNDEADRLQTARYIAHAFGGELCQLAKAKTVQSEYTRVFGFFPPTSNGTLQRRIEKICSGEEESLRVAEGSSPHKTNPVFRIIDPYTSSISIFVWDLHFNETSLSSESKVEANLLFSGEVLWLYVL